MVSQKISVTKDNIYLYWKLFSFLFFIVMTSIICIFKKEGNVMSVPLTTKIICGILGQYSAHLADEQTE